MITGAVDRSRRRARLALAIALAVAAAAGTPAAAEPAGAARLPPAAARTPAAPPVCEQATEAELRENVRLAVGRRAAAVPGSRERPRGRGMAPSPGDVELDDVVAYLRALEPRRAALLYQVRAGALLCTWLVSPAGAASHVARVDPAEFAALAVRLFAALGAGDAGPGTTPASQTRSTLREAGALVFPQPIAEKLLGERVETLVVLPAAELEALPYAALPIGLSALVDVVTVQIAPGFEAFARPPARARQELGTAVVLRGPRPGLVLAQPAPPSPADEEARAVARMLRTKPLLGQAATARDLERRVRDAGPRLGALYVAARGAPDPVGGPALALADRHFTMSDIERLPLRNARPIAVLVPEEERPGAGAGALPLARAFARAGASAVAASLWGAVDPAAEGLVTRFLSEATVAPPETALRAAMLAARSVRREPAHWARLALVGLPQLPGEPPPRRPCATSRDCGPSAGCERETCEHFVMTGASYVPCPERRTFEFEAGFMENESSRSLLRQAAACAERSGNVRVRLGAPSHRRLDAFVQTLLALGVPRGQIQAEGGAPECDRDDVPECRRIEVRIDHLAGAAPPTDGDRPADTLRMVRYPSLQAPSLMKPRQTHAVVVALADRPETPVIVEGPGGVVSPGGDVTVEVPRTPDLPEEEAWRVRVDLTMPDAEVKPASGEILLRADGGGLPASFTVRPLWTPVHVSERRETPLLAVFSRDGKVFARALRMITVTADPNVSAPARDPALVQGGAPETAGRQADLYVQVLTIPRAADAPPDTDRVIVSAKLVGEAGLATDMGARMDGLDAFLVERYARLSGLAPRGVSEVSASPEERAAAARTAAAALRQLGQDLWDRYTPNVLRDKLRALQRELPRGADVRIQTNDPRIPWELLLVPVDGAGDCSAGARCELLGVLHRVSRWHVGSALGVNPDVRTREGDVAVVAPDYDVPLGGVLLEREALARLGARMRPVTGRFEAVLVVLGASPAPAVLHYAGHGVARPGAVAALERFGLSLEDRLLDIDTFRQHAAWRTGGRGVGPLVFLNACDVGRAAGAYGFVEGWGPAALERGAAGFIGGLWPLGDSGAAEFSRRFYEAALAGKGVAEAVRQGRAAYADSGDPTYAAYVFYGHPDLRIAGPP